VSRLQGKNSSVVLFASGLAFSHPNLLVRLKGCFPKLGDVKFTQFKNTIDEGKLECLLTNEKSFSFDMIIGSLQVVIQLVCMFDTTSYIRLKICKRVVSPFPGMKFHPRTGHSVDNVFVVPESDELEMGTKLVLFKFSFSEEFETLQLRQWHCDRSPSWLECWLV
jgi:hypothetical protein